MKLKLDDKGQVVTQEKDGVKMPVYVHDDGREVAFDAPAAVTKISTLNKEAQGHREAKEAAEGKLKAFEGIEDAEAARKAVETLKNIDEGKLLTAGKVQEIKDAAAVAARQQVEAASKASQAKIDELTAANTKLTEGFYASEIGGSFARSKFITEKMAIHPDVAQSLFGKAFKIEDGKKIAYDHTGNKVYSREKPGEIAEFDEALSLLVDAYPHKAQILKGSGANGGGAGASNPGANGGKPTITRAAFEALSPAEKMKASQESTITD